MKRQFLTHFLVLALAVFGLTYFVGIFIERDRLKDYHNSLLLKSENTAKDIITILTAEQIKDKALVIELAFNELLDKEPTFSSYQLGKIEYGIFQPAMASYKDSDYLPKILLEDLFHKGGKVKQNIFDKDPYLIYHKDLPISKKADKRLNTLFIAYTKKDYIQTIYKHLFAYSTIVIILAVLIFNWYKNNWYKKKEKSKSYKSYADKIRIDELFIDKHKGNSHTRERKYG